MMTSIAPARAPPRMAALPFEGVFPPRLPGPLPPFPLSPPPRIKTTRLKGVFYDGAVVNARKKISTIFLENDRKKISTVFQKTAENFFLPFTSAPS